MPSQRPYRAASPSAYSSNSSDISRPTKAASSRYLPLTILSSLQLLIFATSFGESWAWTSFIRIPSVGKSSTTSLMHNFQQFPSTSFLPSNISPFLSKKSPLPRLTASHLFSASSTSSTTTIPVSGNLTSLINCLDEEHTFPVLHIGKRIGSGSYGTVHRCYLIHPDKENVDGDSNKGNAENTIILPSSNTGRKYRVTTCIAKRSWTLPELENNVPSLVFEQEKQQQKTKQRYKNDSSNNNDNNNNNGEGNDNETFLIAAKTGLASVDPSKNNNDNNPSLTTNLNEKASRCQHYWNVERHCFQKLDGYLKKDLPSNDDGRKNNTKKSIPGYFGTFYDDGSGTPQGMDAKMKIVEGYGLLGGSDTKGKGHQWMVFETVGGSTLNNSFNVGEQEEEGAGGGRMDATALTLLDAMVLDWKDQHAGKNEQHHLYDIQRAMNLPDYYDFGDVLDTIFLSLLEDLEFIHSCNVVHRDLKPGNLLCDGTNQRLRLIDFGSAADLDPSPIPPGNNPFGNLFSGGTQRVGLDEGIVAISPVYAAPETFIKPNDNPLSFDVFSSALIMCQLIFNLLDERTDAGFHQQIENMGYDLDLWLERELGAKLRPAGFDDGLEYLGERRGLWGLLKKMFMPNPLQRIQSKDALEEFREVIGLRNGEVEWTDDRIVRVARDEAYFETVIDSFERCEITFAVDDNLVQDDCQEMPRPLHFVASFKTGEPVGLVLAEAFGNDEDDGDQLTEEDIVQWKRATKNAFKGEVFVKGFAPGGQAEQMGIFEIGDRLRGVGELPFVDGGFEQAINMISKQPKGGKSLRLHFDRLSKPREPTYADQLPDGLRHFRVVGQGAWKSKGRRNTQEDGFVLHEVYNKGVGDVLLAGVFDGHGGTAASESVSRILPPLFADELAVSSRMGSGAAIRNALEDSWSTTCAQYRGACENGECVADYDPIEGILFAETGSMDLVAGTTATMAAISMSSSGTKELTILNCGDSRTLLIGQPHSQADHIHGESVVVFSTRDHSPNDEKEIQRLIRGREQGLDYSIPVCAMNQSFMVVGDYQYALCRSLEGSFVTSKGIVSEPDVTTLNLSNILADRRNCALVLACDGLYEVMSNEEIGREVVRMREAGYAAGELAKNLCGQAMKKGSYDNISVVIIYLDNIV